MVRRIDKSRRLSRLLDNVSTGFARQRGLPIVIGIALVIVAFVLQALNVFVESNLIELLAVILQNGGILTALIAMALTVPVGK